MDDQPTATIVVAHGEAAATAAVAHLGRALPFPPGSTVLAPPPPVGPRVRALVRHAAGPGAAVVRPAGWRALLAGPFARWHAVPLPGSARRFRQVLLPVGLLGGGGLVAGLGASNATPIALLAAFAHPRQQAAARLAGPAALAELAAALAPDLVLLAGEVDGRAAVVATDDLIAAELVAVAMAETGDDPVAPWERPTVQRAADLGAGVAHPSRITLIAADEAGSASVAALAGRLGIPFPAPA